MITCILRGQLGNQMFQIATVIAHALRQKTNYSLPSRSGKKDQFPMMFPFLPIFDNDDFYSAEFVPHREEKFGTYSPLPDHHHLQLRGYFQSELYFKEYRYKLFKAFSLPSFPTQPNTVSIHIRRGDSLRFIDKLPQPTDKYLDTAMSQFEGNPTFIIFTDDLSWCRERFTGNQFEFCEPNQDPKKVMALQASMEHNIIVNSTFSWWSAWLNENPNKKVICPSSKSWFGESWKNKLSAQDIPCKDWTQIDY